MAGPRSEDGPARRATAGPGLRTADEAPEHIAKEHIMKFILLPLSAAMLALPLMVQAAPDHHDHGTATTHTIELNAGKKWATDDALRQGMSAIRTLAEKALPAAHAGKLTPARYDALANDINAQIAHIVDNCKLDARADAQLHIIIAELSAGIDAMQGKHAGEARAMGVVQVSQTLNTYGKYFNHPGWKAIKLPH